MILSPTSLKPARPAVSAAFCAAFSAAALLALAGCEMPQIGGPCSAFSGSDGAGEACGQQFYYPTGLAMDPSGEALYLSNGNADLRYAGGTVQSVDLRAFECMLDYTRDGTRGDGCDPYLFCAMDYASSGFRTKPAGCDAARLDGDFPAANQKRLGKQALCRPDLLDTQVIECDEQLLISSAVRVGNFAGTLVLQEGPVTANPSCAGEDQVAGPHGQVLCRGDQRRLWVAVRGDPSVTFVDVGKDPQAPANALSCDDHSGTAGSPVSCVNQRITVRDFHDGEPGAKCATDSSKCVNMPFEPFGLKLDQGVLPGTCQDGASCVAGATCADGSACPVGDPYSRLLVSYLANGEVALIDSDLTHDPRSTHEQQPTQPVVLDVKSGFFSADATGRRSAFALAPRIPGDPHSYWYVTSSVNPTVALFRISDSGLILPAGKVTLGGGPYYSGSDVRDLVFDPCTEDDPGCRAFIVNDDPPSVFTLDTRVDPVGGTPGSPAGLPENQVASIVDTCQGPANLAFRRIDLGSGYTASRIYAVCFDGNQLAVIDPDQERVVGNTLIGRGPSAIAFNFGPDVKAQPQHLRAYVTDYLDMNIAVIDLDPGSPTENHVIARIGLTEPPGKQQ